MKQLIVSLLCILPNLIYTQSSIFKKINYQDVIPLINNFNISSREFKKNPDSIAIHNISADPDYVLSYRFVYNNNNLLQNIYTKAYGLDSIIENMRTDVSYPSDGVTSIIISNIVNGVDKPSYSVTYKEVDGRRVSEKVRNLQWSIYSGDSLEVEFKENKLFKYRRLSAITPQKWTLEEQVDNIVYKDSKIIGYDKLTKDNFVNPDALNRFRYDNTLFLDDDDDIIPQIGQSFYLQDTSYFNSIFSGFKEKQRLVWDINYERSKFNGLSGQFEPDINKHATFAKDSILIRFERTSPSIIINFIATVYPDNKLKSYFINEIDSLRTNFEYGTNKRISRHEYDDFNGFHFINKFGYEYDDDGNILVYKEYLDNEGDGIFEHVVDYQFFYNDGLTNFQNKAFDKLLITPNPAYDFISLNGIKDPQSFKLEIYDVIGNLVRSFSSVAKNYSIADINTGTYYIFCKVDGSINYGRFIKK